MRTVRTFLAIAASALPLATVALIVPARSPAAAIMVADWDAGSDVFDTYCSDCHSVSAKGSNRKGPILYRVMGRRAGTVPGFDYSAGMRSSGIVWNPATLNAYLANPRGLIKDGKMSKGLPKPADRANVIEFLSRPE
jgi:cytochrome c